MARTTWDPAHKDTLLTLSGGNLVATSSAGSGTVNSATYATQAISPTIKQYFEVTGIGSAGTGLAVGQYFSVGVINGSVSLASNVGAVNGAAFVSSSGSFLFRNGTTLGSGYPALAGGQVMRVAVDRANNKLWWAINNNTWSGSAVWIGSGGTTDDPATGIGGMDISAVTGTIYPAFSSAWTGDVATFNGGAPGFAYAVPAGFFALDGTQARATQIAAEHWLTTNPPAQVTQVALEHWATVTGTGQQAVVTQVALEHWATVAITTSAIATLAITQDNQTLAATGTVLVTGTLTRTQADQTLVAVGSVVGPSSGTLNIFQDPEFLDASADILVDALELHLIKLYPVSLPGTDHNFWAYSDMVTDPITVFSISVWVCRDIRIELETPSMVFEFFRDHIVITIDTAFSGTWTVDTPAEEYQVLFSVNVLTHTYTLYVNDVAPSGSVSWV